jgi:flagellar motor protein MotB
MAAGGGGAWKVAYADFVTAMMAFFLVMWIVGQDQKVRRSVADYFSDPMGIADGGSSKRMLRTGSTLEQIEGGSVPDQEAVKQGRGREGFDKTSHFSPNTKVVYDWIMEDQKAHTYWRKQASQLRNAARWSEDVQKGGKTIEQVAARGLAKQLRDEFVREIPKSLGEVHRNLLLRTFTEDVNCGQIAEMIVRP